MNKQKIFHICRSDIELYNKCLYSILDKNEIDKCDVLLKNIQKCLCEQKNNNFADNIVNKTNIVNKNIVYRTTNTNLSLNK